MKTAEKILDEICEGKNVTRADIISAMESYAIKFSKWLSAHEEIVLIDGNWYHREDEDGEYPFSEEEMYEQFKKQK